MVRGLVRLALLAGGVWCAACGGGSTTESPGGAASAPAGAPAAAPAPAATVAAELKTPADLFPESPQKAAVLTNCASCHNLACSVIGQWTAERWDSLQKSHADKVSGADVVAMFAYLKSNFDSTKPEPKVPPSFLEGGCTPF